MKEKQPRVISETEAVMIEMLGGQAPVDRETLEALKTQASQRHSLSVDKKIITQNAEKTH